MTKLTGAKKRMKVSGDVQTFKKKGASLNQHWISGSEG